MYRPFTYNIWLLTRRVAWSHLCVSEVNLGSVAVELEGGETEGENIKM